VPLPDADWLGFCRRAGGAARAAVGRYATTAERAVETGRGEGGDTALVIDRAAEDAVVAEAEALGVPLTLVSEERGELAVAGGGSARLVVDPVDGSLNAKRGLPHACVSIAVASGPRMADVEVGWVGELDPETDWWAIRGEGAFRDGERLAPLEPGQLEIAAIETARPSLVAGAAPAIESLGADRIRILGAVATSLCHLAAGHVDAMLSLREIRSVDAAAAQLLVTEVGGATTFPGGDTLDLRMRSRVLAARDEATLARLRRTFG
jgi:myo-inositol-1(or 4)-monophosphatase